MLLILILKRYGGNTIQVCTLLHLQCAILESVCYVLYHAHSITQKQLKAAQGVISGGSCYWESYARFLQPDQLAKLVQCSINVTRSTARDMFQRNHTTFDCADNGFTYRSSET